MSDIQNATIDAANAGTEIPGEAAPVTDVGADIETRAKVMGWVPKEDFRGPADKWRDAGEFVQRGEEELPVLRERSRDLARRYADLEAKNAQKEVEYGERFRRQEQMAAMALRQQRDTIEANYEAAKRQAVEIGDVTRYEQLNRDQRQAVGQFDHSYYQAVSPQNQDPQQAPIPREMQTTLLQWQTENPWFFADQAMNQYAQAVHMNLNASKPGMALNENLAEVSRRVRENFADKFGSVGGRPSAVEGGNGLQTGSKRMKGASDLPPEARRAAEEFVRAGAFKNVSEYAKSYWSMEG
jgi:hypothetical protein